MYRGSEARHVLITRAVVNGEEQPLTWPEGKGAECWKAFAEEETLLGNNQH
jgi:hypothetical protein